MPKQKATILDETASKVEEIERQYRRGLITEDEQYVKTVELWTQATDDITEAVRGAGPRPTPSASWPTPARPRVAFSPSGSWPACAA